MAFYALDAEKTGPLTYCPTLLAMLPGNHWLRVNYRINTPSPFKYRCTEYIKHGWFVLFTIFSTGQERLYR
ncbi:hypothetical protein KDAU_52150 [Dictyobacter aurantiacus]|uniref:Uncharacterized protein n=1 Tax=Dictyobacter aurantiacus TaxID=1936993 RepID=A0A401ZM86_9CHLR|nr:hypothetical protein KDAU_52150 [Dictyobacter aurantiacus]